MTADPTTPIRLLDVLAMMAYLAGTLGVALFFARRNTSTEEYFVGSRSFAGWVVGLSMLGTIVSSSTFLALPAAAYALDWRQLSVNLVLPFAAILAVAVFIPILRQGRTTSAFEYLGRRYGPVPRLYGALSFVIMQLIRMAQVLFLVSLPVHILSGVPLDRVIVAAGVFVAVYTVVGGIDAVIWTDVIQTGVLVVGGVISVVSIVVALPGGLGEVLEIARAHEKLSLGSLEWDLGRRTFWTVALLGLVNWLAIYGGDQNLVQRYVSARSTREARKATILYSVMALPMWTFFFLVGTCLFAFYQVFPSEVVSGLEADQVLPYFILHHVPAGVAGLVIAAIVAAAMSTLDSSLNAIATVSVVDFVRPFRRSPGDDRSDLRTARAIVVAAAVVMILGALIFVRLPKESMNDVSLVVTSIFGGCLMGLFMLGFFTRVAGPAVTVGLGVAVAFNVFLGLGALGVLPRGLSLPVHSYWVGALVNGAFVLVAAAVSLLRPGPGRDLEGLTVWTRPGPAASGRD